jgi:hypothetical protein|tara:strand:+ start:111 stop:488 length:378 start_codon:yes stop_codon:yes gene_type:complete
MIDEYAKSYFVACMVLGIRIEYDSHDLMEGIVAYLNSTERFYYAIRDSDGIIIHNEKDEPTLLVRYKDSLMKFSAFDWKGEQPKDAGLMVINIVSYLQSLQIHFEPAINTYESNATQITQDDWSL